MSDQRTIEVRFQLTSCDDKVKAPDEISRSLLSEIGELHVASIRHDTEQAEEKGAKGEDLVAVGAILMTLDPKIVPTLVDLLKTWTTCRPTIPVKTKLNR